MALSSAEAEYMALAIATQEVMWIRYLLKEMGVTCKTATKVHMDNKSVISVAAAQGVYTKSYAHWPQGALCSRAHRARQNPGQTCSVSYSTC